MGQRHRAATACRPKGAQRGMDTAIVEQTRSSETNHSERDPFVEAAAAIRALQQALVAHRSPDTDVAGDPGDVGEEASREKPRRSRWWKLR